MVSIKDLLGKFLIFVAAFSATTPIIATIDIIRAESLKAQFDHLSEHFLQIWSDAALMKTSHKMAREIAETRLSLVEMVEAVRDI